ncbi:hypothetical protein [Planotetraspora kaengkrachanensis]|uniref:ACT domain-containing protein n=1 Tax=Planotetraspora kaengkrachanensis TaxID=575193 RepID=A0A8J3V879_9ACTN|nr:hypothetical protein [Planotetraspora kaengkrachanensis]GIG81404.1 hypothetical protein Pka01_45310 [Planotetraspora kaengkrachanensis]
MNIYTVELKNQPGELAHVCEVLGRDGVNIELAGVTAGDHGVVCFTASDESAVTASLEGAGIDYSAHPALQITCVDEPGEGGRFARKLANANVNVEWLVPMSICQGRAVMAVSVDRMDEARSALGSMISG